MPLPNTRADLEAIGYKYDGESHCRGCGVLMLWFTTPNGKKMPMTIVPGTENDDHRTLTCHFGNCPNAAQFRKPKGKKQ
jgi:hypothetical protein